ncbi:MAG: flagellar biosynthesis protein [Firmicutes bacterium]|nr:flagellar biosynthesis protein [Bacillota bacterium]
MVIHNGYMNNIGKIYGNQSAPAVERKTGDKRGEFDKILQEKIGQNTGLKFSKHAEMRLQTRNIHLSKEQKEKINLAVSRAEEKGVRDSLVIMDNLAFVVNVKNRTVITAVGSNDLKENVFTNIDGAVFA